MGSNFDPDAIRVFLRDYRNGGSDDAESRYFGYDTPRWAKPVIGDALLDDKSYYSDLDGGADGQSEYTTASTVTSRPYTMRSNVSSSLFSTRSRRGNDRQSSVGQSSAPSVGFARQTFEQQFAAGGGPATAWSSLWCEFSGLMNCPDTFRLDDERGWINHHVNHMGDTFPQQLWCWFCDHVPFVAAHPRDGFANFEQRMQHIREHILSDHRLTSDNMRPDFYVVEHLHRHGQLDDAMYNIAMVFDETPDAYRLQPDFAGPLGPRTAPPPRETGHWQYHDLDKERRKNRDRDRERNGQHGNHARKANRRR
ncbi:hypothetical protein N656DRAFT_720686 [Canariomyces notabilis]|uniref:Uncharacterized protein n=1 Tax=Canariomyces notabilis TaxID=2074819 RepID=A0AAN6QCQ0_9PEZI|nr:hypothetical protein N656DRAFT_720686 [Canariomyces arenarius]